MGTTFLCPLRFCGESEAGDGQECPSYSSALTFTPAQSSSSVMTLA